MQNKIRSFPHRKIETSLFWSEKRGQGREVKEYHPDILFENLKNQKLKLENELTKLKTKLENATLKATFDKK